MPCTSPREASLSPDGGRINLSKKQYKRNHRVFQIPCGQCLECRLDYAREWAIRCVHEAQMHEKNSFVTLTYADEHLSSPKLIYKDFQDFMKRLRKTQNDPIGVFVTGEYGETNKRPHYHAILFGWSPPDGTYKYSNHNGDDVSESALLTKLWGLGVADYGSVTMQSAGYVARYAAKKLRHGKDGEHCYEPISRKSSKHAIGKKFLETHWEDVFKQGHIILKDGSRLPIPRYYQKWLQKNKPAEWAAYVTEVKTQKIDIAIAMEKTESRKWWDAFNKRPLTASNPLTRNQVRRLIGEKRFDELQAYLKL